VQETTGGPEHRTGADLGDVKPRLHGLDGTMATSAPRPFLVGFRAD
jgi:hypothetical protein